MASNNFGEVKRIRGIKKLALECGSNYVTDDGVAMVEYHIDALYEFQE